MGQWTRKNSNNCSIFTHFTPQSSAWTYHFIDIIKLKF